MKLANFFLMTMLVGTLGVLGCSDDTTNAAGSGGSGTAGTGGSGTAGSGGSGTAGSGGSGTAGSGGSGTAGSGGSGTASNCDYGDCADPGDQRVACETAVGICEATLPDGSEAQDLCIAGANTDACGLP